MREEFLCLDQDPRKSILESYTEFRNIPGRNGGLTTYIHFLDERRILMSRPRPRKSILESYHSFRNIPLSNPALSLVFIFSTTKEFLRHQDRDPRELVKWFEEGSLKASLLIDIFEYWNQAMGGARLLGRLRSEKIKSVVLGCKPSEYGSSHVDNVINEL
jgi:hypothetical protein